MSAAFSITSHTLTPATEAALRALVGEAFAALPATVTLPTPAVKKGRDWEWSLPAQRGTLVIKEGQDPRYLPVVWSVKVTEEGVVFAHPSVRGWSSRNFWESLSEALGIQPQEIGRLPEPVLPLLSRGVPSGECPGTCDCGWGANSVPIHALRGEALEWRRTQAAALLASCEE